MQYPKNGRNKQTFTNGFENANGLLIDYGSGSPEGVTTAPVGSKYIDIVTGKNYDKTAGVGNTGWKDVSIPTSGDWTVSTVYSAGDTVLYNGTPIRAKVAHTSDATSIDTDVNADRWESADGSSYTGLNPSGAGVVGMLSYQSVSGGQVAVNRAMITATVTGLADGIIIAGGSSIVLAKRFGTVTLTTAQWDARTSQTGGLTTNTSYYTAITGGDSAGNFKPTPYNSSNSPNQIALTAVSSTTAIIVATTGLFVPNWSKRSDIIGTWNVASNESVIEGTATTVNLPNIADYNYFMDCITIRNKSATTNMHIVPFAGNSIRGQSNMVLGPGGDCEITKDSSASTTWIVKSKTGTAIWDNTKSYAVGDLVFAYDTGVLNETATAKKRNLFMCITNYTGTTESTTLPSPARFVSMNENIDVATGSTYVVGDIMYRSALGTWTKAIATAETTIATGIVIDVVNAGTTAWIYTGNNTVTLTTGQWDTVAGTTGGLTAGQYYLLSQTTAGKVQETDITSGIRQSVLRAISSTTAEMLFDTSQTI